MKAISIKEPWVSLILSGDKTIETRTWITPHRGNLLIVTSKFPLSPLSGLAVAVVTLKNVRDMTPEDLDKACCEIYPRAQSWEIENLRRIKPFQVKGQLRLYEVDDNLIEYL